MKRALLVSASTVAGIAAVLSYSPSAPALVDSSSPGAAHTAGVVGDGGLPSPSVSGHATPSTSVSKARRLRDKTKKTKRAGTSPTSSAAVSSPSSSGTATSTPDPTRSSSAPRVSHPTSSAPTVTKKPTTVPKPKPKPTPKPTPTPTPTPTQAPPSKTFAASVKMHYGTITVTITTVGGALSDVHGAATLPPQDGRSQRINAKALPTLRTEALTAKSANISTVSGATVTSNAYKQALQAALNQAGL